MPAWDCTRAVHPGHGKEEGNRGLVHVLLVLLQKLPGWKVSPGQEKKKINEEEVLAKEEENLKCCDVFFFNSIFFMLIFRVFILRVLQHLGEIQTYRGAYGVAAPCHNRGIGATLSPRTRKSLWGMFLEYRII